MNENENDLQDALDFLKSYNMDGNAQEMKVQQIKEEKQEENKFGYPPELSDTTLERRYIGLLLNEIKAISVYYFVYDECFFIDELLLNIYKKILFTDGEKYAPGIAKDKFNFSRDLQL